MARFLWGKVYYNETFVGILREETGDRAVFEYDHSYLDAQYPAISYTLPTSIRQHISHSGLHSFFDNLVAEGWLEQAQSRFFSKRIISRFELLLAFGVDCAGAVSVIDPEATHAAHLIVKTDDLKEMAVLASRASLSGVQPKIAVIQRDGQYYPAKTGELSTYIAKFPSANHLDLLINEYLTTKAFKAFLPEDSVVDLFLSTVQGLSETALLIKRFDRTSIGKRIHFEEFNQLLDKKSHAKYDGSYEEMSGFMLKNSDCLPIENYRLYARIVVGFLLGNTDMHFKNFAMFHTSAGLRLTPSYDQVSAALYQYKTLALGIAGSNKVLIGDLKAKHLTVMAKSFGLSTGSIEMLLKQLTQNKAVALEAIASADVGQKTLLKDQLMKLLEARWNGTFALIGQLLSKKR